MDPDRDEGEVEPDDGAPLTEDEHAEVLADIEDVAGFRALLEHKGMRGLVVDCEDCGMPHYFSWDLLEENLRQLLADGRTRVHEPAFSPDPTQYVSWEYARGYADAVLDAGDVGDAGDDDAGRPPG